MNAELQSQIQRCEASRKRIAEKLAGLDDAVLNRRPAEGAWSAGEAVLHMNTVNAPYFGRIDKLIADTRARGRKSDGPYRYGWFEKWFVGQAGPGNPRKLPAPKKFQPPRQTASAEDVAQLDRDLGRLMDSLRDADGLDLAAMKIASPITGLIRFHLGMIFQLLTGHTERHLNQAERAIAAAHTAPASAAKGEGS